MPPFPGLRRFKQGRNFQQWTGNDSKALMKVCISRPIAKILISFKFLGTRFGYQLLKVLFLKVSFGASMPTSTSVTLQGQAYSPSQLWTDLMGPSGISTSIDRYFKPLVSEILPPLVFHCHSNMQWFTIISTSKTLERQMVYAHPSRSPDTFLQ